MLFSDEFPSRHHGYASLTKQEANTRLAQIILCCAYAINAVIQDEKLAIDLAEMNMRTFSAHTTNNGVRNAEKTQRNLRIQSKQNFWAQSSNESSLPAKHPDVIINANSDLVQKISYAFYEIALLATHRITDEKRTNSLTRDMADASLDSAKQLLGGLTAARMRDMQDSMNRVHYELAAAYSIATSPEQLTRDAALEKVAADKSLRK